jgi:hypothetical protein
MGFFGRTTRVGTHKIVLAKDRSVGSGHNSPPSAEKATKMLKHGRVRGKRLTGKQRRFFQAIKHGFRPSRMG